MPATPKSYSLVARMGAHVGGLFLHAEYFATYAVRSLLFFSLTFEPAAGSVTIVVDRFYEVVLC